MSSPLLSGGVMVIRKLVRIKINKSLVFDKPATHTHTDTVFKKHTQVAMGPVRKHQNKVSHK